MVVECSKTQVYSRICPNTFQESPDKINFIYKQFCLKIIYIFLNESLKKYIRTYFCAYYRVFKCTSDYIFSAFKIYMSSSLIMTIDY